MGLGSFRKLTFHPHASLQSVRSWDWVRFASAVFVTGGGRFPRPTDFVPKLLIHLRDSKVSVLGIGFVSQFRFAQKEQALRRALVHAVQAGIIAEDEADGLLIIEDEASGERAVAHGVLSGTLLAFGRNGTVRTGATGAGGFEFAER